MPHIIWRSRMSVGVERIDEDHRQLIRCLNELDQAINHAQYDPRTVAKTLLRLVEYTKSHFDREEKLMQAVDYPDFAAHKRQHDAARQALHEVSREFMATQTKAAAERIYDFTADWLLHHIVMIDTKITPFVVGEPAHAP